MVIDGQMNVLPADAVRVDLAITGDPMAGLPEAGQFLDIQMQQLPGCSVLVAIVRRRRLQLCQPVQTRPAQQASDGARGHGQLFGDLPISLPGATLLQHLIHDPWRCRVGTVPRSRGSIG